MNTGVNVIRHRNRRAMCSTSESEAEKIEAMTVTVKYGRQRHLSPKYISLR